MTAAIVMVLAVTFIHCTVGKPTANNLCSGGKSYCEDPKDYPLETILQALKNQSHLVQTPGLFDSVELKRGRALTPFEEEEEDRGGKIVENEIVSY